MIRVDLSLSPGLLIIPASSGAWDVLEYKGDENGIRHRSMTNDLSLLSERERAVLRLVATGATNQQIAEQLDISTNTVKVHMRNIFGKIGAASRTEATLYAVRSGLVSVVHGAADVAEVQPTVVETFPEPLPELPAIPSTPEVTPTAQEAEPVSVTLPVEPSPVETLAVEPVTAQATTRNLSHRTVGALGVLIGVVLAATIIALVQAVQSSAGAGRATLLAETPQVSPSGSSGSWVPRTPLAQPLIGAAAVVNSGPIFVIGGTDGKQVLANVSSYDPLSDTWTPHESKPTAVRDVQAASVVLNGKIYVPGGRTADGKITNLLEIYDPKSHAWAKGQPLPAPRSAYGLVVVGGQLYLFGGWDGTEYRAEVYRYDPSNDRWDELTPMPTARAYACVVAFEEGVYVIGGENRSGPLYNNEEYTPSSEGAQGARPWRQRTPLPQPISKSGCGAVDNKISIFGGSGGGSSPVSYDTRTDTWLSEAPAPISIGEQPAVAYRDGLFFIIGGGSDASPSEQLYAFSARYNVALPVRK